MLKCTIPSARSALEVLGTPWGCHSETSAGRSGGRLVDGRSSSAHILAQPLPWPCIC